MQRYHCDRQGCDKSAPVDATIGWWKLEPIDSVIRTAINDGEPVQYCSLECVHLATAP